MTVDTPKRGGRPRTGRVVRIPSGPNKGLLQAVVVLADGSTHRAKPFPKGTSLARAKDRALVLQEQADREGIKRPTPPGIVEQGSGDDWWDKYLAFREGKGLSPVLHLYRPHIKPVLGGKHPADWTRADCEGLVTSLDAKVASTDDNERISWKTAANVWSLFTKACKVACSAKAAAGLKVRADNPAAGVEGPDRGEDKSKQWLFPTEAEKLLACEDVPERWRILYALLMYTYVRAGELTVLEWGDVNMEVGTIHVSKAWDTKRKRVKAPKSRAGVRYVPIEPSLMPLLKAMRQEANGKGRVIAKMPPMEDWAERLRFHLQKAGVTRAELFEDSATVKHITLHDLRSTGITWRCLRKDYGPAIQEAAGHEKYDTTDGYIRTAQVFVGRVGVPFPPLPPGLTGQLRSEFRSEESQVLGTIATPAGIEPALPA